MNQGEFLPDREADNDTLIGLIDLVMRQVEEVERSTGAFGIFTKFISEEELITVQFRPTPASRPAILDRLRLIELPNVIASFVYERESKPL